MTVNANSDYEFSISQIVLLAYRKAGLVTVYDQLDEEMAGAGRLELEALVDSLQTSGQLPRAQDFIEVSVSTGVSAYNLPDNVLHPIGVAMYVSDIDAETQIMPINAEDWHLLSSKTTTGRPTSYYTHRGGATLEVRLWPVPASDGTVRFRVHKLRADSTNGSKAADFERYWATALIWGLAYQLAMNNSQPLGKVALLKTQADEYLEKALGLARENVGFQLYPRHSTPWSR
jgi:hypothetical protein